MGKSQYAVGWNSQHIPMKSSSLHSRWDTHAHPLVDFSSEGNYELIPGQDYNNARVQDFKDGTVCLWALHTFLLSLLTTLIIVVRQWDLRLINKSVTPRMPWHDVSLCIVSFFLKAYVAFVRYSYHYLISARCTRSRCFSSLLWALELYKA